MNRSTDLTHRRFDFCFLVVFSFIIISISCTQEKKPLLLHPLFADHMVLQQNERVPIWGSGLPGGAVSIIGSWGQEAQVEVGPDGIWHGLLQTTTAGGPYTVKIATKTDTLTIVDVLFGEVWLASGQSNMEMPLEGFLPGEPIDNNTTEIANANYPDIRWIDVDRAAALEPQASFNGQWKATTPQTAADFSATAYFFARGLHLELEVPIGIISSSWGGTPVESWISQDRILELGEFEDQINALRSIDQDEIDQYLGQFNSVPVPSSNDGWGRLDLEDANYSTTDLDDSKWLPSNLPGYLRDFINNGAARNGAFWFRKEVTIDNPSLSYKLVMSGSADDSDITYINGQKIGSTVRCCIPRTYDIDVGVLHKGINTIAIRLVDTGGPGGFAGDIYLESDGDTRISLNGAWKCKDVADIMTRDGQAKFYIHHTKPGAILERPEEMDFASVNASTPGVLYNGMIAPLIPYTIKGAIWYQGESNVGRASQYAKLFPGMIEDWRTRWGEDFAFYFVQIAPFGYGNDKSPALRDAQRKSLVIVGTGMAVTMDIGDKISIHPGNKQDVGGRLARLALAKDYNRDMISAGPLYKGAILENGKILLSFTNVGSGLIIKHDLQSEFEIAGADMKFVPAQARVVGELIEVKAKEIRSPQFVRYGWRDTSMATLFNIDGFPASSFSTE